LVTAHLTVDVARAVEAFIDYADTPRGALIFYGKLNAPTQAVKNTLYITQTVVGDCFAVWRCYIVWGKRWSVIIVPVIMLIGFTVSGIGTIYTFSQSSVVFTSKLAPWIASTLAITLATNVTCTGLIAYRIWLSQRATRDFRVHSPLMPVMITMIESGVLYSAAALSCLVAYASGSNGQYAALDVLTPVIGIAFSMIIVRVGLGISSNGNVRSQRSLSQAQLPQNIQISRTVVTSRDDEDMPEYSLKAMGLPFSGDRSMHSSECDRV